MAGYEFSALENKRLMRLTGAMQLVAGLEIVLGILAVFIAAPAVARALSAHHVLGTLLPIAAVGVPLVVGIWTHRAAGHLRLIVRTEGDDIRHLMAAVGELTRLYTLQLGLFLALVGFVAFTLLARGTLDAFF
jgi:hypothetical protein